MTTQPSNSVQRRKNTRGKSKSGAAAQPTAAGAPNDRLWPTTTQSSHRLSDSASSDCAQAQSSSSSSPHPAAVGREQRSVSASPSVAAFCAPTTRNIVQCCHDVNCHMNTPTMAAAAVAAAAAAAVAARLNKERSPSTFSTHSLRSTAASISSASTSSVSTSSSASASASTARRRDDGSPDSGISSDWIGRPINGVASLLPAQRVTISLQVDPFAWLLLLLAFATRFYKLATPSNVVFDELHYGKYISLYMRNVFFFDQHPPLGKQLIAAAASLSGSDCGNFTFPHIGARYSARVPILWMRFVPALCGSLLPPTIYQLLLEARLGRWSALLGGLLVVCDNALLTQSRFVLMESMLLLFAALGLCCLLKCQRSHFAGVRWFVFGAAAALLFACAGSVKYVGFLSYGLAIFLMGRFLWDLLYDATVSNAQIVWQVVCRMVLFSVLPLALYTGVFYVHLTTLYRAGPQDSVMTSAFQASLDGGLAAITRGQPLNVVHGSQITLRHTHGRPCWLHSHPQVYPVRYPDKRGSSHQQQVTCYSFKDVNNWWIVKRPEREHLVVGEEPDPIRHGDIVQLVHGITSRALNSHDVAAPMTPQCQEVSCYIDYEIKMAGEMLWRVEILNRDAEGPIWHAIKSQIRLVHVSTGAALRFSGRQLPDWGFNQHEVVADRVVENVDAIWNVEEHRYTSTHDQRERERQMLSAEMIPTKQTRLSFLDKFLELQSKMLWHSKALPTHMYASEPFEWPLLDKGIAYWVDGKSNGQIHLLGNLLIWYTGTLALVVYAALAGFYLVRRHRRCFDLPPDEWQRFSDCGDIFFIGYLIHYLPFFFADRILFLHHYLPALLFKLLLLCYVLEHFDYLLRQWASAGGGAFKTSLVSYYRAAVLLWVAAVVWVFVKFLPLSYGRDLSTAEVMELRWKDTWDFIVQEVGSMQ